MNIKTLLVIMMLVAIIPVAAPFAEAQRQVLDISLVSQDPQPATPGQLVDIVLKVENKGEVAATGLKVEFVENYPFSVADNSAVREIGFVPFLNDEEPLLIRFKVDIDDNAPDGDVPFDVRMTYDGASNVAEKEFTVDIQAPDASILIDSVKTTPNKIFPGQEVQLALVLNNPGSTSLRDVSVKLDLGSSDLPLTPKRSASTKKVNLIRGLESKTIAYTLIVDADAVPQAYKIPVELTFSDNLNNEFSQDDVIGVLIDAEPKVTAYYDETTIEEGSTRGTVTVKVVNQGFTDVKFLTVTAQDQDGIEVLNQRKVYVGNLDSDDFETVTYDVLLNSAAERQVVVPVVVEFTDTNNEQYVLPFDVDVRAQPASQSNGGSAIVVVLLVIVVVVGIIWYVRKKRRAERD